jgi:hypothetical protein
MPAEVTPNRRPLKSRSHPLAQRSAEAAFSGGADRLTLGAWIIAVGSAVTCVTRTLAIAKRLHSPA